MWIQAIFGTVAVATIIFHWCVSRKKRPRAEGADAFDRTIKAQNVLIAIAHPDDECLFFAPTIIGLVSSGCNVHVLCLSAGGYRGLGLLRKVELRNSCRMLGVNIGNVTVVEHSSIPDDPSVTWSKRIVRGILLKYCTHLKVDTVITFDSYGVSGHLNHAAIYTALEHLHRKGMLLPSTRVFLLHSVNLVRKYSGLLDVLLSHGDLSATHIYVSGYRAILRGWRAMLCHRTQLTWFRVLYLCFSRYMIVNTLSRMRNDYYRSDSVGTRRLSNRTGTADRDRGDHSFGSNVSISARSVASSRTSNEI